MIVSKNHSFFLLIVELLVFLNECRNSKEIVLYAFIASKYKEAMLGVELGLTELFFHGYGCA